MTFKYEEIVNARMVIGGSDATYAVQFDREFVTAEKWEFDPMTDCNGRMTKKTGFIRVRFCPVQQTMKFLKDSKRETEYKLCIDDARILYKYMKDNSPSFWFVLDMANYGKRNKLINILG